MHPRWRRGAVSALRRRSACRARDPRILLRGRPIRPQSVVTASPASWRSASEFLGVRHRGATDAAPHLHRAAAQISICKSDFPWFLAGLNAPRSRHGDLTDFLELYVFLLAGFLGYQIITKVPALLHTPLMSATNAISGISLVGSLVAAGGQSRRAEHDAGRRGRHRGHDQRRRRLHDHRPHAQDVQAAGKEIARCRTSDPGRPGTRRTRPTARPSRIAHCARVSSSRPPIWRPRCCSSSGSRG